MLKSNQINIKSSYLIQFRFNDVTNQIHIPDIILTCCLLLKKKKKNVSIKLLKKKSVIDSKHGKKLNDL